MFPAVLSNSISDNSFPAFNHMFLHKPPSVSDQPPPPPPVLPKKKRNLPGNPDPDAEVIALSPTSLLATNRFVCEICNKGFQRDQNLQLHRRGHNLPWKLKQRNSNENRKRAYVCPEPTCVHHHPSRALGDLTGIKKHYCRKHGEKKWKCEKCDKIYAVRSDWKAHSKTCGTREYKCDCGTLFARKDSFITHRAFCDALAEESARLSAAANSTVGNRHQQPSFHFVNPQNSLPPPSSPPPPPSFVHFSSHNRHFPNPYENPSPTSHANSHDLLNRVHIKQEPLHFPISSPPPVYQERSIRMMMTQPIHVSITPAPPAALSATALLQKAAAMGSMGHVGSAAMAPLDMHGNNATWQKSDDRFTRDFLGLAGGDHRCGGGGGGSGSGSAAGGVEFGVPYGGDDSGLLKYEGFGYGESCSDDWGNCCRTAHHYREC
ncbi:hypothetical protein ACP275_14G213000 [Erythranthe tilingii]